MSMKVSEYKVPKWAECMKPAPAKVVQTQDDRQSLRPDKMWMGAALMDIDDNKLSMKPTPIHQWRLPGGVPDGFEVLIKRDDLTGAALTGNKVRKLDFILADAMGQGCKHIISCGSVTSNHARATAVACAQLGLQCHIFLIASDTLNDASEIKSDGNMFFSKLCGAQIYCIKKSKDEMCGEDDDYETVFKPRMEKLAQKIKSESGEDSYFIPYGGSSMVGKWGYFDAFEEILNQGVDITDIICSCGSGGMQASLAIANYLAGSPFKIHGVIQSYTPEFFLGHVTGGIKHFGISDKVTCDAAELITYHQGYNEPGYDRNTPQQLEFIAKVAQETGIIMNNCYNGKTAFALHDLLHNKPQVFKGKKILLIHSGGMFSLQTDLLTNSLMPYATKSNITIIS